MRVKALKNRVTTYLSIMVNDFVQLGTWYNFIPSQNYVINICKIVKLIFAFRLVLARWEAF